MVLPCPQADARAAQPQIHISDALSERLSTNSFCRAAASLSLSLSHSLFLALLSLRNEYLIR